MSWKFELLMKPTGVPLTEGPVWDGEFLYFTHFVTTTQGHFFKAETDRVGWAMYP